MATVQSVIDATKARFADPDETTWADAELLAYCQKGVEYIQQTLINRNDITATKSNHLHTVDGTETYTLASLSITDFVGMYRGSKLDTTGVWIDDAFLTPCRYTERVAYVDTDESEPEKYYLTDTAIGLLPVPDTVYQVDFLYFFKQPTLAVGSSMPFNDAFNIAIGEFIDGMAFARNEQDISGVMQLYNELESKALGVVAMRTPIKPAMRMRRR